MGKTNRVVGPSGHEQDHNPEDEHLSPLAKTVENHAPVDSVRQDIQDRANKIVDQIMGDDDMLVITEDDEAPETDQEILEEFVVIELTPEENAAYEAYKQTGKAASKLDGLVWQILEKAEAKSAAESDQERQAA